MSNSSDNPDFEQPNPIVVSAAPVPLTVEYVQRRVTMHHVSSTDLDLVASLGNSIHLTFFGVCVGGAVTCWVVLKTATVDPSTHTDFAVGFAAAVLFSAYFGIRALFDYRAAKRKLREIKGGK